MRRFVRGAAAAAAVGVGLIASTAAGQEPPPPPAPTPPPAESGPAAHGFVTTAYRYRSTHDDADQDVWQLASLDVGDPVLDGMQVHVLGRWLADLDGDRRRTGTYAFDELSDVRAGAVRGFVHEAWVALSRIPTLAQLRLGRQTLTDVPEARQIDGALLASTACPWGGLSAGGYAGVPIRQYDRSPGWLLAGVWLAATPASWVEARLDWMHAEERADAGRDRDDLWGGLLRLVAPGWGTATVRHTRIGSEPRETRLDLAGTVPEWSTSVAIALVEQRATITSSTVLGFDELATAGFPLYPYRQVQARVTQPLGEPIALYAGVDARRVTDRDDVSTYNRDVRRWQLGATLSDWPVAGVLAELDWSLWDAERRHYWTLGGGLGYRRPQRFEARVGSDYQHWAVDGLTGMERSRVRTLYAELRVWLHGGLDARLRYAVEEDDLDRYHRVEVRCTWRF